MLLKAILESSKSYSSSPLRVKASRDNHTDTMIVLEKRVTVCVLRVKASIGRARAGG